MKRNYCLALAQRRRDFSLVACAIWSLDEIFLSRAECFRLKPPIKLLPVSDGLSKRATFGVIATPMVTLWPRLHMFNWPASPPLSQQKSGPKNLVGFRTLFFLCEYVHRRTGLTHKGAGHHNFSFSVHMLSSSSASQAVLAASNLLADHRGCSQSSPASYLKYACVGSLV